EAAVALPALFERYPDLTLAAEPGELLPLESFVSNGYRALPAWLTPVTHQGDHGPVRGLKTWISRTNPVGFHNLAMASDLRLCGWLPTMAMLDPMRRQQMAEMTIQVGQPEPFPTTWGSPRFRKSVAARPRGICKEKARPTPKGLMASAFSEMRA